MNCILAVLALTVAAVSAQHPRDFYTGCGETKTCWGTPEVPSPCIDTMTCTLALSWFKDAADDLFHFEIFGESADLDDGRHYIATGFSAVDNLMGDDTVLACYPFGDGAHLYWNVALNATSKYSTPVGDNSGLILEPPGVLMMDGAMSCHVDRPASLTFLAPSLPPAEHTNDLAAQSFFSFLASGPLSAEDEVTKHTNRGRSAALVDFNA